MDLTLPLDYAAIERILPHRFPFLLVDRITEFEVDKRIVGIKNVSLDERYLSHTGTGAPVLPPTILTETVAQVGAILILVGATLLRLSVRLLVVVGAIALRLSVRALSRLSVRHPYASSVRFRFSSVLRTS